MSEEERKSENKIVDSERVKNREERGERDEETKK